LSSGDEPPGKAAKKRTARRSRPLSFEQQYRERRLLLHLSPEDRGAAQAQHEERHRGGFGNWH
jgi:hypothetical protein